MWALVFFHPLPHALQPSTLPICQKVSWGPGLTLIPRGHPDKRNAHAAWFINSFIKSCETGLPEWQWHDDFYWLSNTGYRTSSTPTDPWLKLHVWAHMSTLVWLCFEVLSLILSTQAQPRVAAGILYSMWPQLMFSPASTDVRTSHFPRSAKSMPNERQPFLAPVRPLFSFLLQSSLLVPMNGRQGAVNINIITF